MLSSIGESTSWTAQKRNAMRIFGEFITARLKWLTLDAQTEADAMNPTMYEDFATYLCRDYKSPSGPNCGNFLAPTSAASALRVIISLASDKFKASGSVATKLFFTCVCLSDRRFIFNMPRCIETNSTTESGQWLKGLSYNVTREGFQRMMRDGNELDAKAEPIYLEHVRDMCRAYATHGAPEAAERKFCIVDAFQMAGRSGELSWVMLDNMVRDSCFSCVIAEVPQAKVSKVKLAAFVAGAIWEYCFFTQLGDSLVLVRRHAGDDEIEPWPLHPGLGASQSRGTRLGTLIRALLTPEAGSTSTYADVAVTSLAKGANAQGDDDCCYYYYHRHSPGRM